MKSEERGSGFIAGFLLGSLVGAATALLLTPKSGEETRFTLKETGIELREKAEEAAAKAREEADELIVRGKALLEEKRERVKEAMEEGKESATHKKAELLSKYRIAKEKGEVPSEVPPTEETTEPSA